MKTNSYRGHTNQKGFTLIEIMIVVVIVAILAAIALPMYNSQVRTSKRSDAINKLEELAQEQEQFYNANNAYQAVAAQPSDAGHYQVTVTTSNNNQRFLITAVGQGDQANDTGCTTISLNSREQYDPAICVKQ